VLTGDVTDTGAGTPPAEAVVTDGAGETVVGAAGVVADVVPGAGVAAGAAAGAEDVVVVGAAAGAVVVVAGASAATGALWAVPSVPSSR
jgi:hypothetical protein